MRVLGIIAAIVVSATIHAQTPTYQRGQSVRVRSSTTSSDNPTTLLLRIVAIPGDRIRVDDSQVYVNDVIVGGFSTDFLARVAHSPERTPALVPEGHYFVMGEQRLNQDISEYWGMHPEARLVAVP